MMEVQTTLDGGFVVEFCSICGEIIDRSIRPKSKLCSKTCSSKNWRLKNAVRIREYNEEYYAKNLDRFCEKRLRILEKIHEYQKRYRERNPEKVRRYGEEWRKRNKEKLREIERRYRKEKGRKQYPPEYYQIRPLVCLMYGYKEGDVDVHHIDRDPTNNELENLIALPQNEHRRITTRQRMCEFKDALDQSIFYSITKYWR